MNCEINDEPGHDDNLNSPQLKELLDNPPISSTQSFVQITDSLLQSLLQRLISEPGQERFNIVQLGAQIPIRLISGGSVSQDIKRSQA